MSAAGSTSCAHALSDRSTGHRSSGEAPRLVGMTARLRLIEQSDAARLARLRTRDRDCLAPFEPIRPDAFFTADGQGDAIKALLEGHAAGRTVPMVVLDDAGDVVGQVALNSIIRGAFQSASIAYWIAQDRAGQGLATAAVRELVELAFGELRLHRVQAEVLPHNRASLRVLEKTGFVQYGLAPAYLHLAGRWQEHALLQLVDDDWD